MSIFSQVPKGWEEEAVESVVESREKLTEQYFESDEYRDVPFAICLRLEFYTAEKHVPWNRPGECFQCGVDVVYDARVNAHKAHVCVPCAYRLAAEGMRELSILAYDPDLSGTDDQEWFARLAAQYQKEAQRGNARPGKLLPADYEKTCGRPLAPHLKKLLT